MNARRGLSQILFGFLPDQTVDLAGRVWRVRRWVLPRYLEVDRETVRREVIRAVKPWAQAGRDGGLTEDLFRGVPLHVLEVNEHRGVEVEQFPQVFRCTTCSRLERHDDRVCRCGARTWVQWHFVSYHDCGYVGAPRFRRCSEHDQVKVVLPGTAAARDLRFECPLCRKLLHTNFFMGARCDNCDQDTSLRHDVHRAAIVYSPRTLTVVNPPDPTTAEVLRDPTAGAHKLDWVLDGMPTDGASTGPSIDTVIAGLVAAGLSTTQARDQAERMAEEGALGNAGSRDRVRLDEEALSDVQQAALRLWLATSGGRTTVHDLDRSRIPHGGPDLVQRYEAAFRECGLEAVELLDNFPVLTCRYGYTRGSSVPGLATLRRYRTRDGIAVHGSLAKTEGLLVRMNPCAVASWLHRNGHLSHVPEDCGDARARILEVVRIPDPYDDPAEDAGTAVLTLIHSVSHRLVRRIASMAGIDRDAIAEYLVPEHLSFVLYAVTRGDFVLGGMQALFESDLHYALRDVAHGESRCALDPACRTHGGACVACLHLGEPSCRHFNRFLSRKTLFDPQTGFLVQTRTTSPAVP